jgi:hypothetical protein
MHNLLGADFFITAANVLYVLSYLVRDILWLRILTVLAGTLLLPYYYVQPKPLWMAIGWGGVFIFINVFWIVRLALERRPVQLVGDTRRLHELAFRALSSRQMLRLVEAGSWMDIEDGTCLVERDRKHEQLSVILSGRTDVFVEDKQVGELREGEFVGQVALVFEGETKFSVRAAGSMRILTWDLARLQALMKADKDLAIPFEAIIGRNLAKQLVQTLHAA